MKKIIFVVFVILISSFAFSYEIATIYSDYSNSIYKNELKDTLRGNNLTPYMNTNLEELVKNIHKYDVIVGGTLYNYTNPVDWTPYGEAFRNYVENGGVMIFCDVNYIQCSKVIRDIFPEYYFEGGEEIVDPTETNIFIEKDSPFLKNIDSIPLTWGQSNKVSDNFVTLTMNKKGRPIIVYAPYGKGFIFASNITTWFPNSNFVKNILTCDRNKNITKLSENFSYNSDYEIVVPNNLYVGKIDFKLNKKASTFKLFVDDKEYVSKNGHCYVNFDKAGKYNLMASVYDKKGDVLAYTKPITCIVKEQFECDIHVVYPYYRDIVQSKDPNKTFVAKIKNLDTEIKNPSVIWTLKSTRDTIKTINEKFVNDEYIEFTYDLSQLPAGKYFYSFALKSNGKTIRNINKSFEILPPAPYEVTFDRKKVCYVNGEPYFPNGMYHTGTNSVDFFMRFHKEGLPYVTFDSLVESMKERHFNMGHCIELSESDINKFSENNMFYVGEIGRNSDTTKMDTVIDTYKKTNSGILYYTYDEPIGEGFKIAKTQYDYLRSKDPYRPVAAAVNLPRTFNDANEVFDIMLPDCYPITGTNKTPSLARILDYIKPAMEVCDNKKPLWGVPQAFGYKSRPEFSVPTSEQAACEAWFYITYGATGLFWYAHGSGEIDEAMGFKMFVIEEYKDLWDGFINLNKEIQEFFPIIYKGERIGPLNSDNKLIHSNVWTCEGKNYAVIVNPEPSEQKATFEIKGEVKPYFENKNINMTQNNGVLSVTFKPYESLVIKY